MINYMMQVKTTLLCTPHPRDTRKEFKVFKIKEIPHVLAPSAENIAIFQIPRKSFVLSWKVINATEHMKALPSTQTWGLLYESLQKGTCRLNERLQFYLPCSEGKNSCQLSFSWQLSLISFSYNRPLENWITISSCIRLTKAVVL